MYKDVALKMNYYRECIVRELSQKGIYPDSKIIKDKLTGVDAFLSILAHTDYTAGDDFDTEQFNSELLAAYNDLKILYQLLYQLTVADLRYVKAYADSHLRELETLANNYSLRSKMEMDATTLGKTVFYQASGYNVSSQDNSIIFNLGNVELTQGAVVPCLIDSDSIDPSDVLFAFKGDNLKYCSPYQYNNDMFSVDGQGSIKTYNYSLQEDQQILTSFQIAPDNFTPSDVGTYVILGGKDKLSVNNEESFLKHDLGASLSVKQNAHIEFYVYGGTHLEFNFSKEPLNKNFDGSRIAKMKRCHNIIMDLDEQTAFDINTDGLIFAVKQMGVVKDGKLYCPQSTNVRDFVVLEYVPGEKKTYTVYVQIVNGTIKPTDVNYIALKEIDPLEATYIDTL